MKKILLVVAALAALGASAESVTTDEAARAAANWLASGQAVGHAGTGGVAGVAAFDATGGEGRFYAVSITNAEGAAAGYVITSADRKLNPVLAYSASGSFEATDDNPLWVMLGIDVAGAAKALETAGAGSGGSRLMAGAGTAQNANERKWAALLGENAGGGARLSAGRLSSVSDLRVGVLLETSWGQRYHGENYYTPNGYVCGCVATAMAQIMRYWKYPTQSITLNKPYDDSGNWVGVGKGTWSYQGAIDGEDGRWDAVSGYKKTSSAGYTAWSPAFGGTYDWNNMPAAGASSDIGKAAIGKLTRDCGISVHMDYKSGGSGASNYLAARRLTDQFGYANAVVYYHIGGCTLDEIKRAILPSLDMKSPCGVSVPGHAIIADGYGYSGDTLYIHFNLGWSGTDNAWYAPPDLTDADSDFSSINAIYYNVYPPSVCSEAGRTVVSGRILGTTGKPVAGAVVTAQNTSSGAAYSAVAATDAKGIYALLVPAGGYKVRASLDGNAATVDVTVESGSSLTVDERVDGASFNYYSQSGIGIGCKNRNIHGLDLTLIAPLAAPTFAPKTGTVFFRDAQPVTIACADADAQIRYTLDGSEPTEESALYEGPLSISASATIKARAFKEGRDPSEVASAAYSRRAIIGENLVQNAAPVQGETQTLGVAAPGIYAASFSYAGVAGRYGESVELRLAKGGVTRTLATVAAVAAGTFATNFTFEVAEAGEYDLFVYNPRSGTSQPVSISALSIAIPGTEAAKYWIYETEQTCGSTGEWDVDNAFQDGKLTFDGGRGVFTPYGRQDGRRATITFTSSFDALSDDEAQDGPTSKAAVNIAADAATGGNTFRLLTAADGVPVWRNVRAEGVGEPALNVPYTFKFVLDCTNATYAAYLVDGGAEIRLTDGDVDTFAFANGTCEPVGEVRFEGLGSVEALYGDYGDPSAFAAGDVLSLAGGAATNITAGQAAWLNSMDAYEAVGAKIGTMGAGAFADAWLLNLDLMQENAGLVAFKVSGIEVTETDVRVSVRLERRGALASKINGTLRLYGGATLDGTALRPANLLNVTPVTNADFGDGETAVFVYPRSGDAKFFRPAIENAR